MEIVCANRFYLHEEEPTSKVKELLRFDDNNHQKQEEEQPPQTLGVLLSNGLPDANALNSGSVALDIPCDLPNSENMNIKFNMICPEAGARSSDISTGKSIILSRNVLLLIATFFATITFQVPFHFLGRASKEDYVNNNMSDTFQVNKQFSILSSMFLLLNSMVFIASVVATLFLLHEFPMKPWPQISVSALFGSYMCSIKAISPNGALALLFISIPFSLLAVVGKLYGFARHNFRGAPAAMCEKQPMSCF